MQALAHSANETYPAQTYAAHITGVFEKAVHHATEAERYSVKSNGQLKAIVQRSAIWHDLGKLDPQNQAVLRGTTTQCHLPVNHVDAGTALLKASNSLYSAIIVYSHHKGLPEIASELNRGEKTFRGEIQDNQKHTDSTLQALLEQHRQLTPLDHRNPESPYNGNRAVFLRMALSCLADADHTDTAAAYGQAPQAEHIPLLRAEERLAALDRYISNLSGSDTRSQLRKNMYAACRNVETNSNFTSCDSPVGSGKTTAVMAHLLQQAIKRNARRIFVVLPYTNIIQQSVDVYRNALVLPGEDPEAIVAELHCRADFQDKDTRYLTSLWRAPIIVTTAVAFFQTLASNRPATLRRLHELPGSVIFVDESHNALPLRLLPLAWRWMNTLAEEWNCYWVLASGSLVRFWQLRSLQPMQLPQPTVTELVEPTLRKQLMQYEQNRIAFRWQPTPLNRQALISWVHSVPGPRLLIVNTIQNAAVIADNFSNTYGRAYVEHLSTALTPQDRNVVIQRVKARLQDPTDTNWTLVATSCVEAGVDFSFRTGFRETASLLSLLQAAGRVNRHGSERDAEMWSFSMQEDSMLKQNLGFERSEKVLKSYLAQDLPITPELSTQSLNDEIIQSDHILEKIKMIQDSEDNLQFKTVAEKFQVIDSNTVTAIVDEALAKAIRFGGGNWQLLQKQALSIRIEKVQAWHLKEIANNIYQWTLPYDSFLGYMRGVLNLEKAKFDTLIV